VKLRTKTGNKYNEKRKMVSIFQNQKWKNQYAIEINNKFEILENFDDEDSMDTILTKNGKTLKQQSRKINSSLQKRMKVQKDLKINGMMRNANLQ